MSWKGSLEITYSFSQRFFNIHLQTLSGDVESKSSVVLSWRRGCRMLCCSQRQDWGGRRRSIGESELWLWFSNVPAPSCRMLNSFRCNEQHRSLGPARVPPHPLQGQSDPRWHEDRHVQPGHGQRCGVVAPGRDVCVPLGGLCSITATPGQGFGGIGTTKIHQQWAQTEGVGWIKRIWDFKGSC